MPKPPELQIHDCARELWRYDAIDFTTTVDCSCGRVFEHRERTLWLLLATRSRNLLPAWSGEVWVDVTSKARERGVQGLQELGGTGQEEGVDG